MKTWLIAICLAVIAAQAFHTYRGNAKLSATEDRLRSVDEALQRLAESSDDADGELRSAIAQQLRPVNAVAAPPVPAPERPQAAAFEEEPSAEAKPEPAPPPPLEEKVEQAFVAEDVDPGWAEPASARIVEGTMPILPAGSSLRDVDCRSTVCRVEVQHTTAGSHQGFIQAAVFEQRFWQGPGSFTRVTDENGQEVTLVYLGREDADPSKQALWQ